MIPENFPSGDMRLTESTGNIQPNYTLSGFDKTVEPDSKTLLIMNY
jgi:hypothetical protein